MANTNIKEFFLVDATQEAEVVSKPKKKVTETKYDIATESGQDVVIVKTKWQDGTQKKNSEEYLALLTSQKLYYTKVGKTGEITKADAVTVAKFFNGIEGDYVSFNSEILPTVFKKKDWAVRLMSVLNNDDYIFLLKKGLSNISELACAHTRLNSKSGYRTHTIPEKAPIEIMMEYATLIERLMTIFSEQQNVSKKVVIHDIFHAFGWEYNPRHIEYDEYSRDTRKELNWDTVKAFIAISNIYGQDIAKDIFAEWAGNEFLSGFSMRQIINLVAHNRTLNYYDNGRNEIFDWKSGPGKIVKINFESAYNALMKDVIPLVNFEWRTFKNYLLNVSLEQGYASNMDTFLNLWSDTLAMQLGVYQKITDKYPENLSLEHNVLSWKFSILSKKIDEEKMEIACEKAKKLEGKFKVNDEMWALIAPGSRRDILDEASQMSNCVASYVSKMSRGECTIMFLRKADKPEKSVCTVEISPSGEVVQFKAKHNASPSANATAALQGISAKVGLVMPARNW